VLVVPLAQRGEEPGHVGLGDLPQPADAGRGQVLGVPAQVTAVGGDRVGRQPALDREVVQIAGDDPFDVRSRVQGGAQVRTSWSGTAVTPWASATSGSTIWPATTFTPCASAGFPATAAAVPSLASAIT
jgi:hypothetical protein